MRGPIRVKWGTLTIPLRQPYHLSFATLDAYHSVWVAAQDQDDIVGLGEAIALPGYSWETNDSIERTIAEVIGHGEHDAESLIDRCVNIRSNHPFAASAIMTALELPAMLPRGDRPSFPVNAPLSGEATLDALRVSVDRKLREGFFYLKIKVGQCLKANIEAARALLEEWQGQNFKVLFDANQGFSRLDALQFAETLRSFPIDRLLWFEQPVDRTDWSAMEEICKSAEISILLDECIYDEGDVRRAASIGAAGVKLKLFKNFGAQETIRLARLAREIGLFVVLGNGVATDIGNLAEYSLLASHGSLFTSPAECNGFQKLSKPALDSVLGIDRAGHLTCLASAEYIQDAIRRFIH